MQGIVCAPHNLQTGSPPPQDNIGKLIFRLVFLPVHKYIIYIFDLVCFITPH